MYERAVNQRFTTRLRTSVVRNGVTNNYIFRGTEVSHELDENSNVKNREVRGYKLLSKDTSLENRIYFYLHNEHSDITNLVDKENTIKNKYEYDVFGDVTVAEESVDNDFKYYEQLVSQRSATRSGFAKQNY